MNNYLEKIIPIAVEAGEEIMKIYRSADFGVEMKADNSPLTLADRASHNKIVEGLKKEFPDIPILSEEGREIPFEERKKWEKFWLVDPLDGTKEFIKKNDEFTVNIALIENNQAVLGVIYAPALDNSAAGTETAVDDNPLSQKIDLKFGTLYFGGEGIGAFKMTKGHSLVKISVNKNKENGVTAVQSRSHASEEEESVFKKYGVTETISAGSSIKFCRVAEGVAHLYYRHGPTNEWDVGAGYAIAKAAGAEIEGLQFNKKNVLNGSFLVRSV